MPARRQQKESIWVTLAWGLNLAGLGGIALVALHSSGLSEISIFGQHITSTNAGVTSFFLGVVMIILGLRRVFSTIDKTIE